MKIVDNRDRLIEVISMVAGRSGSAGNKVVMPELTFAIKPEEPDKIYIAQADTTRVAAVSAEWKPKAISDIEIGTDEVNGVRIASISTLLIYDMLKRLNSDIATIEFTEDNLIRVYTEKKEAKIRQPEANNLYIGNIPNLDKFIVKAGIDVSELQDLTADASEVKVQKYTFEVDGMVLTAKVGTLEKENKEITTKLPASIEYLNEHEGKIETAIGNLFATVVKSWKKTNINMYIGNNYPIKLEYNDDTLKMEYIIAPMVE